MGWGVIIAGLIMLYIYPPLAIAILILGFIILAFHARQKAVLRKDEQRGTGDWKKCPKCTESVKKDAVICRFCKYEFPSREIEVRDAIEKWLSSHPNVKKHLSDSQLYDHIQNSYVKEEFEKCKYYCERVIQEYPKADCISFAKDTLEKMNIKLGIEN